MNEKIMRKEINFDRFVRGLLFTFGVVAVVLLLDYLKPVIIPFLIAWVFAYMLYPVVIFLEKKCRLRSRILCIFLTLILLGGLATGVGYIIVPPFINELANIKTIMLRYLSSETGQVDSLPIYIQEFFRENVSKLKLEELLRQENVQDSIKNLVPKAWDFIWSTAGTIISLLSSLIALLYFFFLLKDYERYATGWIEFVPKSKRKLAKQIVGDIERGMNGYFRGQALVALSNCIMFSVGFLIIGFPMPIALGCFIGIISFVPYLQVAGILPCAILALLQSADKGQNFWWLMTLVLLVYIVVQVIQDSVVTPHVMGKIMGLSPAIILLSLTIWGYLMGIIGLIIALPITTLMLSYYKRYVINKTDLSNPSC